MLGKDEEAALQAGDGPGLPPGRAGPHRLALAGLCAVLCCALDVLCSPILTSFLPTTMPPGITILADPPEPIVECVFDPAQSPADLVLR